MKRKEAQECLSSLLGDSLAPPEVDFDRLLASLKDLSELVVEGEKQVVPVAGGARFRTLEPIPLKLYRNGLIMFDGPFRPFFEPATQVGVRGKIRLLGSLTLVGSGGALLTPACGSPHTLGSMHNLQRPILFLFLVSLGHTR